MTIIRIPTALDYWRRGPGAVALRAFPGRMVRELGSIVAPFCNEQAKRDFPYRLRRWAARWHPDAREDRHIAGGRDPFGIKIDRSRRAKAGKPVSPKPETVARAQLERIAEVAGELETLLDAADALAREHLADAMKPLRSYPPDAWLGSYESWVEQGVGHLALGARHAASSVAVRRGPRSSELLAAGRELRLIWIDACGERPTITGPSHRSRAKGRPSGAFVRFVREAAGPLWPGADLDHLAARLYAELLPRSA